MPKKLKIIVAIVASVVVLALAGGAIALAADTPPTTTTTPATPSNSLFAKVATTLGVTETQLTDAFKQAGTQLENQRLDQALAQAVTNKTITQDEANAIKAWLAQKPAALSKDALKAWEANQPKLANPNALKGLLMGPSRMMSNIGVGASNTDLLTLVAPILSTSSGKTITVVQLQAAFTSAEQQMKATAIDQALANAVKNGKLTQPEADQIKAWWGQRPAAVDKLAPNVIPGVPGIFGGSMIHNGPMMRPGFKAPGTVPPVTQSTTPKATN